MPTRLLQIIDRNDDRLSTSFDHARTSDRARFFLFLFFFYHFIDGHRWKLGGRVQVLSLPTVIQPIVPLPSSSNGTWSEVGSLVGELCFPIATNRYRPTSGHVPRF